VWHHSWYGNDLFGPNDKITREQALTIIARAMKITGLELDFVNNDIEKLHALFADSQQIVHGLWIELPNV
jgi:hypothetical protein